MMDVIFIGGRLWDGRFVRYLYQFKNVKVVKNQKGNGRMNKGESKLRIGILGGGIAGLSCALALRERSGVQHVRIFEKDSRLNLPHRQGHGLILMQNGVQALEALGVTSLLSQSTPLKNAMFQNEQGQILQRDTLDDVYSVSRMAIINGLLLALPSETVIYQHGTQQIVLNEQEERVQAIHFDSGELLHHDEFDLLIDATGVRSPLCQALNGKLKRPFSRVKEIVTSTYLPELAAQLGSRFIKTTFAERGLAFGLLAPTADRVIGFLQFDSTRYTAPKQQEDIGYFLQSVLDDAPALVRTYLQNVDLSTAHVWHPVDADMPPRWHNRNSIAIGDAAHPLLPFTSQGVSAALEDSIMLADAIREIGDNREAIPQLLTQFSQKRQADLYPFIDGGRKILQNFVDESAAFVLPYVDGRESALAEHLGEGNGR